jgi:hypothetical protein
MNIGEHSSAHPENHGPVSIYKSGKGILIAVTKESGEQYLVAIRRRGGRGRQPAQVSHEGSESIRHGFISRSGVRWCR